MYNGQPPPRPPFPPNFAPNPNGPPPTFPPFRPPFPPNFPPGAGAGAGTPPPLGFRPPPPGMGFIPPRPYHPGLGLTNGPPMGTSPQAIGYNNLNSGTAPGFVREVKTTSVFVGGIAPGTTDDTLKELLNACGPLHELKRVIGASGKPQAFGFAAFENPEVVLRVIRCLNGVELPDLTPEGRRDRKPAKPLIVKADQKTTEFLQEFEDTLGRSDSDETADATCRKSIQHIVALLTDPNAIAPEGLPPRRSGGRSPIEVIVPAHLQDLKEGDLPEEQRVVVLDQIAVFRENAARREREKKNIEEEKERYRSMEAKQQQQRGTGNGYGPRSQPPAQQPQRTWGSQAPVGHPSHGNPNGAGPSQSNSYKDPQGYSEPVAFVRAQGIEGKGEGERTDEEEEEMRQLRRTRERDAALRDREQRVEARERQRIDSLNRESMSMKQQAEYEERNRKHMSEVLESWDDDDKLDRGRELYYSDRSRWRAQRQQARLREYQDDVRSRQQEEDELKALERESEDFLQRQMVEMAELEEKQRRAGLLFDDAAPVKLALQVQPEAKVKDEKPDVGKAKAGVTFDADEDEDALAKKKRTLVKLEYDGDGLTEAERLAKRNARLLEIREHVPRDKRSLWALPIEWAAIKESIIKAKISPFVREKMTDFLGEADEDLANFVLEHVREKKGPSELVEGLEPVLVDEATTYVVQLWRLLAFESAAYIAGIETGAMMMG
ncbi:RNA-binding protein 25, partial [Tremellales sp. Uapishka_1]